jgi:hypothetical protein
VITKAAGRGAPAVGFDVSGVRDAILDLQTGLFASAHPDFASHCARLAQHASLRATLGRAAEKRGGTPWTAAVNAFEGVAAEAVTRHRSRHDSSNGTAPSYRVDTV